MAQFVLLDLLIWPLDAYCTEAACFVAVTALLQGEARSILAGGSIAATSLMLTNTIPTMWLAADAFFAAYALHALSVFAPSYLSILIALFLLVPGTPPMLAALAAATYCDVQCVSMWLACAARLWAAHELANMFLLILAAELFIYADCGYQYLTAPYLRCAVAYMLGLRLGDVDSDWMTGDGVGWRFLPAHPSLLALPATPTGVALAVLLSFLPVTLMDCDGQVWWGVLGFRVRRVAVRPASPAEAVFPTQDNLRRALRLGIVTLGHN